MPDALPSAAAQNAERGAPDPKTAPWRVLAPLPDRVGFGGMFAGVLAGRLVAGGGSQFPGKPLWQGGEKTYSDRIFTLAGLGANWVEHAGRLPRPLAHFATTARAGEIHVVGGTDASGPRAEGWVMRVAGDGFDFARLPDLPRPVVYAAAAIAQERLFVAGGQHEPAEKRATTEMWSLDLRTQMSGATWRREPDLPGAGCFVGAMGADATGVTWVGGVGFDAAGKAVQSRKAFRFDLAAGRWETLPDLPEPRVGAVSPIPVLPDGRLWVIGGYAAAFPGDRRDHPGFSAQTYLLDVARRVWSDGPVLPHVPPANKDDTGDAGPAPMIAAPGVIWEGHVVVVGGEVRAGTRTPAVVAGPLPR